MPERDAVFAGSIPEIYYRLMGPLFFAPFAAEMTRRVEGMTAGCLLETACGTGILTAGLAATLPAGVVIIATDLNQPMLDHARTKPALTGVTFRQADAQALPFPDAQFDAVLCQFGAMFFPDRVAAYREARRVLVPGGRFLFSTWDSLDHTPLARAALDGLSRCFSRPGETWFIERTPHGYHDIDAIRRDLRAAGWPGCRIETMSLVGHAASARSAAIALCHGTPMRAEIEAFGAGALDAGTDAAAAEISARFGEGPFAAPSQAHIIEALW